MKPMVHLSLLTSIMVINSIAADDLATMFSEGKASGQARAFYINRDSFPGVDRDGLAIGGYLKYETASLKGLSLGAALYTTNKLDKESDVAAKNDTTLFGKNGDNKTYLGEAYLQYKYSNTTFKAGRQKLDTPLAGPDDARMLPSLFEAYVLSNTDLKDTTLIAAHVTKFAPGTFANAYDAGGVLGLTSGYSNVTGNASRHIGEFTNMGEWAIGRENNGVSVLGAMYSGIKGLKVQFWDYYAYDILNAIYADATYGWSYGSGIAPYVAVQYIREDNVGDAYASKVQSNFVAGKVGIKVANFDVYGAVSHNSKDSSSAINGGTITPWGGMPAYTQGMVTRHQFMAGTDTYKVAGSYDWKAFGVNLSSGVYYTQFKMDSLNGYSTNYSWTASESGFDMIYSPQAIKNVQLRFRGNFPRNFKETATTDTNWDEYRFIVNYNF